MSKLFHDYYVYYSVLMQQTVRKYSQKNLQKHLKTASASATEIEYV